MNIMSSCYHIVCPNDWWFSPFCWRYIYKYIYGGVHKWCNPKWLIYNGKSYSNGWFRGTPISGNLHMIFIYIYIIIISIIIIVIVVVIRIIIIVIIIIIIIIIYKCIYIYLGHKPQPRCLAHPGFTARPASMVHYRYDLDARSWFFQTWAVRLLILLQQLHFFSACDYIVS